MNSDNEIKQALMRLRYSTGPELDERIRSDAERILEERSTSLVANATSETGRDQPESSSDSQSRTAPRRAHIAPRMLAWASAIVLLSAGAFLWWSAARASPAWAQVVEAVRARPWVRLAGKAPDGTDIEIWFSPTRQISAGRYGREVEFEDHRRKVTYRYYPQENVLHRQEGVSDDTRAKFLASGRFFEQLFRGEPDLSLLPGPAKIVEQTRKTVRDGGRTWIEYRFALEPPSGDEPAWMAFRIDPETRLPHSFTMTGPDEQAMEFLFSFPETGPTDVYALGVPREAKVEAVEQKPIDRVAVAKRPLIVDDRIKRLVEDIKKSVDQFDPFIALNVSRDEGDPWYVGSPSMVWQKGNRSRTEYGIAAPGSGRPEPPPADTDRAAWWKARWKTLLHVPHEVSDGQTAYWNEAKPAGWEKVTGHPLVWDPDAWPEPKWKWGGRPSDWPSTVPLHMAYPQNIALETKGRRVAELDPNPPEGPPGTVLVTTRHADADASGDVSESRYWIDPSRSHMTVRQEWGTRNIKTNVFSPWLIVSLEKSGKSPKGFWYPTLLRHTEVIRRDGKTTRSTYITRHYVDFDAPIPDSVFQPGTRPDAK